MMVPRLFFFVQGSTFTKSFFPNCSVFVKSTGMSWACLPLPQVQTSWKSLKTFKVFLPSIQPQADRWRCAYEEETCRLVRRSPAGATFLLLSWLTRSWEGLNVHHFRVIHAYYHPLWKKYWLLRASRVNFYLEAFEEVSGIRWELKGP